MTTGGPATSEAVVPERVAPGIWSIPVPIPHSQLGYTLVYLIESGRGPVLIDAGSDGPGCWEALSAGFEAAGSDVNDCYGVALTHMHSDHHGLSGKVREHSGAWIAMHPADARQLEARPCDHQEWKTRAALLVELAGGDGKDVAEIRNLEPGPRSRYDLVKADRKVLDGDFIDTPGRKFRAVWTPGHSPGHTCYVAELEDILFSGDHVLPRITPNISLENPSFGLGPLDDYLKSLTRTADLHNQWTFPAHQYRFQDGAQRMRNIQQHHRDRLQEVIDLLSASPLSIWQIAQSMTWSRSWGDLDGRSKCAALRETLAHLQFLARPDGIRLQAGVPLVFEIADSAVVFEMVKGIANA